MSASGPLPPTVGTATAGTRPAGPSTPPPVAPPAPQVVAPPAPPPADLSAALARFAVAGLLATLDAHRAGTLPTPRLGWELRARLDQLAAAGPPDRALTRLRWLAVVLEHAGAQPPTAGAVDTPSAVDTAGAAAHGGTDIAGRDDLEATVAAFRAVVAHLTPDPIGAAGAARPRPPLSAVGRPWVA